MAARLGESTPGRRDRFLCRGGHRIEVGMIRGARQSGSRDCCSMQWVLMETSWEDFAMVVRLTRCPV